MYWHQRSRVAWLEVRDRNTNFFHSKVSFRKRKNLIDNLKDNIRNWRRSDDEIIQVMEKYFREIFRSTLPNNEEELINATTGYVQNSLLTQYSLILDALFSSIEVKQAMMHLGLLRAPGLDGFLILLY